MPDAADESQIAGSREGHLAELFEQAGLGEVEETALSVTIEHASFDAWWEPFTRRRARRAPTCVSLDPEQQARLRELSREKFDRIGRLEPRPCAPGRRAASA